VIAHDFQQKQSCTKRSKTMD